MVFRGKKIETFVIPSSLSTFSVRLIFGDGIDKPRFIVIGIQTKPNNLADDQFNSSTFNVPTANQIDVKKITTTFNDKIIATATLTISLEMKRLDGTMILKISGNRIMVIWLKIIW